MGAYIRRGKNEWKYYISPKDFFGRPTEEICGRVQESGETFTLNELTEEFFDDVVLVHKSYSSGLGGPGCIVMITEDGEEYFLGCEGYDEFCPEKTVPLLKRDKKRSVADNNWRPHYLIEDNGWILAESNFGITLVRGDFYKKIFPNIGENRKYTDLGAWAEVRKLFNDKGGVIRKNYIETQQNMDEEERYRLEREAHRREVRLTDEDIEWKYLYPNNLVSNGIEGEYLLLFKRNISLGMQ